MERSDLYSNVYLNMCRELSRLSTCRRRKVGCLLLDKQGFVISSGFNGAPRGFPHCIDKECPGVGYASTEGLDECQSIHAEINAIVQCENPKNIHTCYTTASPCMSCIKALLSTNCKEIYFKEKYDIIPIIFWRENGRKIQEL